MTESEESGDDEMDDLDESEQYWITDESEVDDLLEGEYYEYEESSDGRNLCNRRYICFLRRKY